MEKSLRIFISATWDDLRSERTEVEKTLQRQEIAVESMGYWGSKSVDPTKASFEKLDKCNLYVGILGFKYGEITEQEYNYALQKGIYRLIYVRDDKAPVSPKFVEQDPKRLRKLQSFKKRLEKEITFTTFKSAGELSTRVLQDVLEYISRGAKPIKESERITLSLQKGWLSRQNLLLNPFQHNSAQHEQNLADYYVEFSDLQLEDLRYDTRPYVVFGDTGFGKSALSNVIAAGCYPYRDKSNILAIQFDIAAWEEIYRKVQSGGPFPQFYMQQILRKAVDGFRKKSGNDFSFEVQDRIERFERIIRGDDSQSIVNLNYIEVLGELSRTLKLVGFEAGVCLLDQVNEITGIEEQDQKILSFLAPLMSAGFRDVKGLHYRFFLPTVFEEMMNSRKGIFHLDAYCVKYIEWDRSLLKRLISDRMKFVSRSKYSRFWQICQSDLKLIDDYLTAKENSDNNPRAVLWLANRLIELHCQPPSNLSKEEAEKWEPAFQISLKTWVKVKSEWDTKTRKLIVGAVEFDPKGFNIKDGHCYFSSNKLPLKPEHESLLTTLMYAQGEVCSNEMLIIAMWPEEAETRNTHNLQVEVSRLKEVLKKQKVPGDWIQNIRSEGYQLTKSSNPTKRSNKRKK